MPFTEEMSFNTIVGGPRRHGVMEKQDLTSSRADNSGSLAV